MNFTFVSAAIAAVAVAGDTAGWKQRSVYQVLTDRFARTDGSTSAYPLRPGVCHSAHDSRLRGGG